MLSYRIAFSRMFIPFMIRKVFPTFFFLILLKSLFTLMKEHLTTSGFWHWGNSVAVPLFVVSSNKTLTRPLALGFLHLTLDNTRLKEYILPDVDVLINNLIRNNLELKLFIGNNYIVACTQLRPLLSTRSYNKSLFDRTKTYANHDDANFERKVESSLST